MNPSFEIQIEYYLPGDAKVTATPTPQATAIT